MPDAKVLVKRLREVDGLEFGNSCYRVAFDSAHATKRFPSSCPFGIAYRFTLMEAVDDCQEYLVPLEVFSSLASRFGLELEYAMNFTDFFGSEYFANRDLLQRMRVLPKEGFISDEEWDVAHSYLVFSFVKLPAAGEAAAPLRPAPRTRHRPVRDTDVIKLSTSQLPFSAPHPAEASARADSTARAEEAAAQQGGSPERDEGETRTAVQYGDKELFD